jgi:hypothetical protein
MVIGCLEPGIDEEVTQRFGAAATVYEYETLAPSLHTLLYGRSEKSRLIVGVVEGHDRPSQRRRTPVRAECDASQPRGQLVRIAKRCR